MNSGLNSGDDLTPVPLQRVIARNTLWNVAGRTWDAISSLVLTPYIVWRVGLSDYGVWGLVGSFSGYVGLLDLGLGSGYAKFIAEYAARGEYARISRMISTAVALYAGLGIVLAAIGFPLLGSIAAQFASLMDISPQNAAGLVFLIQIAFTLFLVGNCVAPFTSVQAGLQRMDLSNSVGFAMSLIKVGATIFFLESGYGIRGLMYTSAIVIAVYAATSIVIAFRLVPSLQLSPSNISRNELQLLFGYGWRAQIARLSNLVTFETDLIIVSLFFRSLGLTGAYKVGVELANKLRQVPLMLLGAILPAASDLDAREEHERLQRLYAISTKYIAAITVPLVAFSACMAHPIMRAWMGANMDDAAWVFCLIVIGYAVNVLQGPGISVALGKGRPDIQMNAGLISMISNIALTIILAFAIGYLGVAAATTISMYLSLLWFLRAMRRLTAISATTLLREALLWPLVAALPGGLVCSGASMAMREVNGRTGNAVFVAAAGVAFFALYLIVIRLSPFLNSFDIYFLENTLKLGRLPGFVFLTRHARKRKAWTGAS